MRHPALRACLIAVVLFTFLLNACMTAPDIPPWFDSFLRLPVKSVPVEGQRIAYLDVGQGPPVILIHGFGGAMWQWEYQQIALSASHRVITPDLLGTGLSDKPDIAYTPTEMLESFTSFMDALGLDRASLVGNSMGAGLVIGMALAHPERVDRLVLIGGFPDHVRDKLTSPLIRRTLDTWAPVWLVSLGNRLVGRGPTETVLREIVHDPTLLTQAVIERSYENRKRPGFIPPLMAQAKNLPRWEEGFAKRLGEIRQLTLILWGAEDKVFPLQVGKELHQVIAGSAFTVIPEAGHIPQWEKPETVNPLLLNFLK